MSEPCFSLGFREEGRPSLFWDWWQQYVITAVLLMSACSSYFPSLLVFCSRPQRISEAAKGCVPVIYHLKVPVNKWYEWMIHSGTKCKQILCTLCPCSKKSFLFHLSARFSLKTLRILFIHWTRDQSNLLDLDDIFFIVQWSIFLTFNGRKKQRRLYR